MKIIVIILFIKNNKIQACFAAWMNKYGPNGPNHHINLYVRAHLNPWPSVGTNGRRRYNSLDSTKGIQLVSKSGMVIYLLNSKKIWESESSDNNPYYFGNYILIPHMKRVQIFGFQSSNTKYI